MDLNWREVYETGIPEIDEQHKKLFNLLADICSVPMHEKGLKLKESMEQIFEYAKYHFKTEEEYWVKINLPQKMVEHHKKEHTKYSKHINDMLKHFSDGLFLSMTMSDFLKNWIIDHILGEDQEYTQWARENKHI